MPDPTPAARDRELALQAVKLLGNQGVAVPSHFGDWLEARFAQARREGREEGLREALRMVPINWCDPLLTGDHRVFDRDKRPEPNVEAVLLAVRERIEILLRIALLDQPAPDRAKE